jgi:predicted dehydrogenase
MTLRGAISGFGAVAANAHLPGWQAQRAINIVAIHDPVAARRHYALNLRQNIRVYDDLALMLDGEALDFVDIASPPAFHASAASLALEAGVNVIVEKPLCLNVSELEQISALAASKNRILMCVHNWKYSPPYRRAHELITAGDVGEVQYVSLARMRGAPAGTHPVGSATDARWRLDSQMGGGILIDHGWHCLYLARWLMGGAQPLSVSSHLRFGAKTGIDDFADLRLHFPGNRTANILLAWGAPLRRTTALILGSTGVVQIEGNRVYLADASGEKVDHSLTDEPEDSYHRSWFEDAAADYERALMEGPHGPLARVNLEEAATTIALMVAARQSAARDGQAVALNSAE